MEEDHCIKRSSQIFNLERLEQLHRRQIHVLNTVNDSLEKLYDSLPKNTYVTITSDHELFGEGGYFCLAQYAEKFLKFLL